MFTLLKSILPYLLDYFKEAFNPKDMAVKTTILERFLILFMLALVIYSAYVTENVFILHEKRIQLEKAQTELQAQIDMLEADKKNTLNSNTITTHPKNNCVPTYHVLPNALKSELLNKHTIENHVTVRQQFVDAINKE